MVEPAYIQAIMNRPEVLRARAAIRRTIAEQDKTMGDTWAYHRNITEAARLEGEAYALEGKSVG